MPEILGENNCYFDPESPEQIARSIEQIILSTSLRTKLVTEGYNKARLLSWERCAHATFGFFADIATNYYKDKSD